jgi:NAD-dependent DNA ligase
MTDKDAYEYMQHAYLYYVKDAPVISDYEFDRMANKLQKSYDKLGDDAKSYLSEDMLFAGTFLGEYPKDLFTKFGELY